MGYGLLDLGLQSYLPDELDGVHFVLLVSNGEIARDKTDRLGTVRCDSIILQSLTVLSS